MFGKGRKFFLTMGLLIIGSLLFNTAAADAAITQRNLKRPETDFAGQRTNQKQFTGLFQFELFKQPNQLANIQKSNQIHNQRQSNFPQDNFQQLDNQLPSNQMVNGQQKLSLNVVAQVADILNIAEEDIISELEDGLTLAEIAESYDVSESTLLEELEDIVEDKLDAAVSEGILSEGRADEIQDQLEERLEQIIQRTFTKNGLSKPDDLTAIAESDSEIELDWDSVSDATEYYVYRSTSSSGSYSKIATVTSSSYSDTDLNDDTTYYYKVKAVNSWGTSAFSEIVNATTQED